MKFSPSCKISLILQSLFDLALPDRMCLPNPGSFDLRQSQLFSANYVLNNSEVQSPVWVRNYTFSLACEHCDDHS